MESFAGAVAEGAAGRAGQGVLADLAPVDGVAGAGLVYEAGPAAEHRPGHESRTEALGAGNERERDPGHDREGGAPLGRVRLAVGVHLLAGDGVQARGVVQAGRVVPGVRVRVRGPAGAGGGFDGVG
ncbi:hypothetical protein [Actinomyces sp.]|uniref:hypothetical protein n=1 Tax=Actinomyces sp. TaxID=29317 RepID=UPI00361C1345